MLYYIYTGFKTLYPMLNYQLICPRCGSSHTEKNATINAGKTKVLVSKLPETICG